MNWLIVKNDLKRNKVINLALLLFMMFSAALAVSSVIMAVQTFTSISEFYEVAQPPHFLQMHKGELNQNKIDDFMSKAKGVTHWQTSTMVDIFGDNLTFVSKKGNYKLTDCRLDIGLVKQNETKDLLLNSKHDKVVLNPGEIGIPVLLKEMYPVEIGDRVILNANNISKEYVVKEFILDAQMNSTMCSSTRILLSDKDFEALKNKVGEKEYLIEAYLTESQAASSLQTAYEKAGLPQNGQAVTYAMIFLLSALTDIVTVFVLLMVSLLLIIVSFICVKFTIMAALEEDIIEIGAMKAIGLPFTEIRSLYLNKYRLLALAAVIVAHILSLLFSNILTKHISTTFGNSGLSALSVILSLAAAGLVYLLINYYCKKILKKIKKVSVVDALVSGKAFEKNKGSIKDGLYKSKQLPVNLILGIREAFYKFNNWVIVFSVVTIAVLMILIPINLINTFKSPEFITYMGSSLEDVLIEVENGENLETGYQKVKKLLQSDISIENYFEYRRVCVQTVSSEGKYMNLHMDCGKNAGNGLKFLSGNAPKGDNEIAISYLNSNEIGKTAGDKITLSFSGKQQEFTISGIYQDVTSGGYTAKSKFNFPGLAAEKYSFTVKLNDISEGKTEEWSKALGNGVAVDPMNELLSQTLGGVVKQLNAIVFAIVMVGLCLVMLITILFLKLRLAKDLSEIAVLKAIGFSENDLVQQYMIKISAVSITGILTGIILSNIIGEKLVNIALSVAGLGLSRVDLIVNPALGYLVCPVILLALILLATHIVLKIIKNYNIVSIINE